MALFVKHVELKKNRHLVTRSYYLHESTRKRKMLPHDFPNNLRLTIFGNYEVLENTQNYVGTQDSAQSPERNAVSRKNFLLLIVKSMQKQATKFSDSAQFCLSFILFAKFLI